MKYIKISLSIFIFTLIFSASYSKAIVSVINDITIPSLSGIWTIGEEVAKYNSSEQKAMKTSCTDNLSGDERAIEARTYDMYGGGNYSSWIVLSTSYKGWGSENTEYNTSYKIQLRAKSSLLTTATFYGRWMVDSQ